MWTDRGAPPARDALYGAEVYPHVSEPRIRSSGYREAIGLTPANGETFTVGDFHEGQVREMDTTSGVERDLDTPGPGVTGLALVNTDRKDAGWEHDLC